MTLPSSSQTHFHPTRRTRTVVCSDVHFPDGSVAWGWGAESPARTRVNAVFASIVSVVISAVDAHVASSVLAILG